MTWFRRLSAAVSITVVGILCLTLMVASAQDDPNRAFEEALRADLDRLAAVVFAEVLPDTWTGNTDPTTPNFIVDLFYDNEQLADQVFGIETRPDEWFGASSPTRVLVARNIRHDLELSADSYYGGSTRPDGWQGAPPRVRCDRVLQSILLVLSRDYNTTPNTIEGVVNYCVVVQAEVEDNIYGDLLPSVGQAIQSTESIGGLRGDLERLVDERLGLNNRPQGWIGNREDGSPTFLSDVFVDLNNFADNQLGLNNRPPGWNGVISASPVVSIRAIRVDLELLTDTVLGEGIRPTGWQGTDPLSRCDTNIQTLVTLVEARYGSIRDTLTEEVEQSDEYCGLLRGIGIESAEAPPVTVVTGEDGQPVDSSLLFKSRNAFAYLDVTALQFMGPMPYDVEFRPWYRNFQESQMMFVTGQDFAVFIDRRWTDMPEEAFRILPNLEGRRPLTFCDATWCNGPGPTPTPTGSGPIIEILEAGTPQPTSPASVTGPIPANKTQVTWNNIRVTYLFDNAATGTALVALEICAETAQISCEGVISVYDGQINGYKPIIQQYNGLNVFEFRYGYQTNVIVEGISRYSRDVFISEPGLRSTQPTATPTVQGP